jgi:hypothetical protein
MQPGWSSSSLRLVSVDDALHQVDQVVQFFAREHRDCSGWAVQDLFGGGDGVAPALSEGDELAATVVGMRTTLNKPTFLELVNDERDVRASRLVELGELAVRQWPGAQLKQDLATSGPEAEAKCLCKVTMTTVPIDKLPHERPGLFGRARRNLPSPRSSPGTGAYHGTV